MAQEPRHHSGALGPAAKLRLVLAVESLDGFDDPLAEVLVDQGSPQVVDFGSGAKPVEHERAELVSVGHRDVQQVVVITGHVVQRQSRILGLG